MPSVDPDAATSSRIIAEAKLIPGAELRVIDDIAGHVALFGFVPSYMQQIDHNLGELFAS